MYKIKAGFNFQTPLRVDMRDATLEDHRKVQEIFFSLGFKWRSQNGRPPTAKDPEQEFHYYLNYKEKELPGPYLFWSSDNYYNRPSLTPQEFYDMVLDTEPSLNLTKEHKRKRFKTRQGDPVIIVHVETELDVKRPVIGYVLNAGRWIILTWELTGKFLRESESGNDLMEADPPVFEHWDILSPTIVAIAKNANGNWHGFTEIPQKDPFRWHPRGGSHFPLCFLNASFPDCHWEDSLIERPNND